MKAIRVSIVVVFFIISIIYVGTELAKDTNTNPVVTYAILGSMAIAGLRVILKKLA